jgi:hypothetical protein
LQPATAQNALFEKQSNPPLRRQPGGFCFSAPHYNPDSPQHADKPDKRSNAKADEKAAYEAEVPALHAMPDL